MGLQVSGRDAARFKRLGGAFNAEGRQGEQSGRMQLPFHLTCLCLQVLAELMTEGTAFLASRGCALPAPVFGPLLHRWGSAFTHSPDTPRVDERLRLAVCGDFAKQSELRLHAGVEAAAVQTPPDALIAQRACELAPAGVMRLEGFSFLALALAGSILWQRRLLFGGNAQDCAELQKAGLFSLISEPAPTRSSLTLSHSLLSLSLAGECAGACRHDPGLSIERQIQDVTSTAD